MMKQIISILLLLTIMEANAQDSSQNKQNTPNALSWSGYVEAYYSYDFNKPADNNKPSFFYSHTRHNEININLALLRATYTADKYRGTFAIGAGTYMNVNYSAEPGTIKNIYEANAGVKLGKNNLWLDAGIFSSHIGFEGAVSKDCWTLTRSIPAENTPYFESGAKLTYITNKGDWLLSGLILNGWQRITRVPGNSLMSFGTQIQYKPSSSILINYSTFIGTDKPDSARLMRYFNNLYGIFTINPTFGISAGMDFGWEQKSKKSNAFNAWYGPVLILKVNPAKNWAFALRGEYYNDPGGVIISTGTINGFKTYGLSVNLDYTPISNVAVRIEGRTINSKDPIFQKGTTLKNSDTYLTTSIALSF